MTIKLVLWPDPTLKISSAEVVSDPMLQKPLVEEMTRMMERLGGVGLAAIQVGVPLRVVVSKFAPPMINPVIIGWDIDRVSVPEGCLSLPGFVSSVRRYPEIILRWTSLENEYCEQHFKGLAAQCFQHELEHLDGNFFIDHLPRAERSRIQGEVVKLKRAGKWR